MGRPKHMPPPVARLIQHTKDLMESEEKLCVKVLRTLQQMLLKKTKYGDRVSARRLDARWAERKRETWHYGPPSLPAGQPAAQDAAAELPPEPEVQHAG